MQRLDAPALRTLSEALLKLADPTVGAYPERMLAALRCLLDGDVNSYNEFSPDRIQIVLDPDPLPPALLAAFEAHKDEHASVRYLTEVSDESAVKLSDFLSLAEWKRTSLYNEFFAPLDLTYQMGGTFPVGQDAVIGYALNRKSRDFTEEDRLLLNLLRPHLIQQWHLEQARIAADALCAAVGMLRVTMDGEVRWSSVKANELLRIFFPVRPARTLPEPLRSWLRNQLSRASKEGPEILAPLIVRNHASRLVVRLGAGAEDAVEIFLEQKLYSDNPRPLEALGLTKRESEVLLWLSRGKTNEAIATILGATPATIGKHVERILSKLGVETRTAAAGIALEILS
jgi:DNA-binding CsgD family transcriptional regulator